MQTQILRRVIALREKTQGFTVDGKPLLALFTCEKQGKEYVLNFTSSNLARLQGQEYYLTLVGGNEETLRLAPQNTCPLRAREGLKAENGLAVLLWTEREGRDVPIAFGISGGVTNHEQRMHGEILRMLRSPIHPSENPSPNKNRHTSQPTESPYQDEAIATENYYAVKEKDHETTGNTNWENATSSGKNSPKTPNAKPPFHPETHANVSFGQEDLTSLLGEDPKQKPFPEGVENAFFNRKKNLIVQRLTEGEKERALCNAVPGGYFVKSPSSPFVFGLITLKEKLVVEDIPALLLSDVISLCYALPVDSPFVEKGKEFQFFLPLKTDNGRKGYLVTTQNPITGNPERISFT